MNPDSSQLGRNLRAPFQKIIKIIIKDFRLGRNLKGCDPQLKARLTSVLDQPVQGLFEFGKFLRVEALQCP